MGLDMYVKAVDADLLSDDQQVDFAMHEDSSELWYWRKHHDLHGWMEKLYYEKSGSEPSFNCVNLQLSRDDLLRLQDDVKENRLPVTSGFFFGNNPPDNESIDHDLEFIKTALKTITEGKRIVYTSWW